LQLIASQTEKVLSSDCWLIASVASVKEVLQIGGLRVHGFNLVRALLSWSQHQAKKGAGAEAELLKAVGLNFNLLTSMDLYPEDFAQLCRMGLDQVFSSSDKYNIFMELSSNQPALR
jgi:hypothetical protein